MGVGERSKETPLPTIRHISARPPMSTHCAVEEEELLLLHFPSPFFGLIKVALSTVVEKGLICFLSPSLFALWPRPIPLSSHARYERLSDGGGESGRDVPFAEKRPFSAWSRFFYEHCWRNIPSVLDTLLFLYAYNLHVKYPSLSCSNGMSNSGLLFLPSRHPSPAAFSNMTLRRQAKQSCLLSKL